MDKQDSHKGFVQGAISGKNASEFTDGIHESAKNPSIMGDGNSALDASGSVGGAFKPEGAVGGTAQKVGGPFDQKGTFGKHFTEDGALGGTAQQVADSAKGHSDGIQGPSASAKAFDAQGSIGSMFKKDGAIGGTAQAIGGPLSSSGVIGKHFNETGSIGGTVQKKLGED